MQTPKPNPKSHRHIPLLSPEKLQAALEQLDAQTNITAQGKAQLSRMMQAASTPGSQAPEVLVRSLPVDRQADIADIAKTYTTFNKGIVKRGKQGLSDISAQEWERMVKAANGE